MTKVVCKQPKGLRLISVWIRRTHHVLPQGWQVIHLTEVSLCLLNRVHAGVDGPHQGLLSWGLQGRGGNGCAVLQRAPQAHHTCMKSPSASSAATTPGHFRELPSPSGESKALKLFSVLILLMPFHTQIKCSAFSAQTMANSHRQTHWAVLLTCIRATGKLNLLLGDHYWFPGTASQCNQGWF